MWARNAAVGCGKAHRTYLPGESIAVALDMGEQMSSDVMDELRTLTVEELSAATGIQAWRIRELVKAEKGPPHFRVGTTYRFPVLGVRRWLEEQTGDPKSAPTRGQSK